MQHFRFVLTVAGVSVVQRWPSLPDGTKCSLLDTKSVNLTNAQCSCESYSLDVMSLRLQQNDMVIVYSKVFISTEPLGCDPVPGYFLSTAYDDQHSVC